MLSSQCLRRFRLFFVSWQLKKKVNAISRIDDNGLTFESSRAGVVVVRNCCFLLSQMAKISRTEKIRVFSLSFLPIENYDAPTLHSLKVAVYYHRRFNRLEFSIEILEKSKKKKKV